MATMYAYGRASTDKQQITLGAQKQICDSYYKLRLASGDSFEWGGWHPDAAVSSTLHFQQRPMGERLMNVMRKGDVLVVSNFDRIFRSVIDCHNCLEAFGERDIKLMILDMDVRTDTPLGACFMKIVAVLKELERGDISRRTRAALQFKKSKGGCVNGKTPIGWKKVGMKRESHVSPYDEERHFCYDIIDLYENHGVPVNKMRDALRAKHKNSTAVCNWLGEGKGHTRMIRCYVAAKCGFPLVTTMELPGIFELNRYMRQHAGLPPRLVPGSYKKGLLHTVPPLSRRDSQPLVPSDP